MSEMQMDGAVALVPGAPTQKPVNKQLYANSDMVGSLLEELALTEGFHNPRTPNLAILHEKPEHRVILLLRFQGFTLTEIAEHTGYTVAWLSQVTRQPWFQARLAAMYQQAGKQQVQELYKEEAVNSFNKIVQLRDHAKSEQVQLASALSVLDRAEGKPVQRTEVHNTNINHSTVTVETIDIELSKIDEEEKRLLRGN